LDSSGGASTGSSSAGSGSGDPFFAAFCRFLPNGHQERFFFWGFVGFAVDDFISTSATGSSSPSSGGSSSADSSPESSSAGEGTASA
jgi:hypothetical protein